jgi:hypothetical protein
MKEACGAQTRRSVRPSLTPRLAAPVLPAPPLRSFRALFSHLPKVYVPHIYNAHTTAKVGRTARHAGARPPPRPPSPPPHLLAPLRPSCTWPLASAAQLHMGPARAYTPNAPSSSLPS